MVRHGQARAQDGSDGPDTLLSHWGTNKPIMLPTQSPLSRAFLQSMPAPFHVLFKLRNRYVKGFNARQ